MRSRGVAFGTAAALLALLPGCKGSPAEPPVTAWQAVLEPSGDQLGPRGTLGAVSQGFNTRFSVQVEFAEPKAAYSWRVREGTCAAAAGAVVGGRAGYPDVVTSDQGEGSASGTVAVRLRSGERYHAVITAPGDNGATLACGVLERFTS